MAPALDGTGALMRSPSHPSSQPASNDCHRLAQPGFAVYSCVTVSGPSGTITEVTSGEAHQVLYSVYRREGAVARLVLVNTGGTDGPPVTFHRVDLAHDGDLKLLAVQKASANAPVSSVGAFDVVEGSGKVVLHVALGGGGGQIAPAPGGGVAVWFSPDGGTHVEHRVYRYQQGAWRMVVSERLTTAPTRADAFS